MARHAKNVEAMHPNKRPLLMVPGQYACAHPVALFDIGGERSREDWGSRGCAGLVHRAVYCNPIRGGVALKEPRHSPPAVLRRRFLGRCVISPTGARQRSVGLKRAPPSFRTTVCPCCGSM